MALELVPSSLIDLEGCLIFIVQLSFPGKPYLRNVCLVPIGALLS